MQGQLGHIHDFAFASRMKKCKCICGSKTTGLALRFAIRNGYFFFGGGAKTRVVLRLDLCGQNVDIVLSSIVI